MHETCVPHIPISTHHWCTSAACLTRHKQPREFDQNLPEINNRMLDYIRTQFKFDWQSHTGQRVGWARKFWTLQRAPKACIPMHAVLLLCDTLVGHAHHNKQSVQPPHTKHSNTAACSAHIQPNAQVLEAHFGDLTDLACHTICLLTSAKHKEAAPSDVLQFAATKQVHCNSSPARMQCGNMRKTPSTQIKCTNEQQTCKLKLRCTSELQTNTCATF